MSLKGEVNRKELIKKVSEELRLNKSEVELAIRSQFSLVRKVIEGGTFELIRLPYFGKFFSKPERRKHLDRHRQRKLERQKQNGEHTPGSDGVRKGDENRDAVSANVG